MIQNTAEVREGHKIIKDKLFKFMPIDKAILGMVIRSLPSPIDGQPKKIDTLAIDFRSKTRAYLDCRNAIISCNKEEPIIVYVTKMQPFPTRLYNLCTRSNDPITST